MKPAVKLSELLDALEFDSPDFVTLIDRETGQVLTIEETLLRQVECGEDDEELREGQEKEFDIARAIADDGEDRFIAPPSKHDFHEYRHMERFIGTVEDGEAVEQLWRAIKGKGAFRYFKDTLHRLGLQDQWYHYRLQALKELCIDWATRKQVPYEDDLTRK
jgi:hypothetical protein